MGPRWPTFFDSDWYLDINPDVAAAGVNPYEHYKSHGRFEGRMPCSLLAAARERDLHLGYSESGEEALAALCRSSDRPEMVWARLALARRMLDKGDAAAAHALLDPIDPIRDIIKGFALIDPLLLTIEAATLVGARIRASWLLAAGFAFFGPRSDLFLAAANVAAARSGPAWAWWSWIAALFAKRRLRGFAVSRAASAPLDIGAGGRSPFDRIWAKGGQAYPDGPLVSVVVPARNAGTTIGTALRGLSAQSWRRLEILVVDNGSTDATEKVVRHHMSRDARIKLIDGSAEPGAYAARNLGMAHARGEFLTVHDADDWSHPARIHLQAKALSDRPSLRGCLTHWVNTTSDLRFVRWWKNEGLIHKNISSLMIRRETFQALGYWDRVKVAADTEYIERIMAAWGDKSVGEVYPGLPLTLGRRSDSSLTRSKGVEIETIFRGPRRHYHLAAGDWHRAARTPDDLYLAQYPICRPFAAPAQLAVGDPPPAFPALRDCRLVDEEWMLSSYHDLRLRQADPLIHYLSEGKDEGRDPGPDFSSSGYLLAHDCGELSPLAHHLQRAGAQPYLPDLPGHLPSPLNSPKILFVGHQARAQIYGAERALLDTLDRAVEAGVVPIVVLPQAMNQAYIEAIRARCHSLHIRPMGWRYGGLKPPARTVAHLVDLIRKYQVAEVHQNSIVLDAPLHAARLADVPAVVHVHELPASDPRLCHDLGVSPENLRQDLLRSADSLIAVSSAVAEWIDAPGSVALLPNRVDPALFDLPFAPANRPRIALIGNLSARKGLIEVLELARRYSMGGGEGQFVLIGPDQALAGQSLPANVTSLGYASDPVTAIKQADIVLSMSRVAESFGRTVLEAMAGGRPVLCWDRGAPPDLVGRDGTAGHVVPADNLSAAAALLIEMTSTPERLQSLSQAARIRARDLCNAGEAAIEPEAIFSCLKSDRSRLSN